MGPSVDHQKQIIQITHNLVKNSNWKEEEQLAIYKCGGRVELGFTVKKKHNSINCESGTWIQNLHFFKSGAQTTCPHCLLAIGLCLIETYIT